MTNKEKLAQIFPDGIEWSVDWLDSEYYESTSEIPNKCEDAISRRAVLDGIDNYIEKAQSTGTKDDFISFEELVVKALPPVTPKQKRGRWIESDALLMATNEDGCMKFPAKECSVCHKPHIKAYWMDYCPNCGAKMVESEDTNGK